MKRSWRVATSALVVALGATAALPADRLRVREDRVTGSLEAVPVEEALDELARATGAAIRGAPSSAREVTARFDDVPLALALPRILGDQSFTLEYDRDGRLAAIVLLGTPAATLAAAADHSRPASAMSPAGPRPFPLVLGRPARRQRRLALPPGLAEAFGREHATFVEVLETAALANDGQRRAEATQVVLSALEREQRLRRAFVRALYALDERTLAVLAEGETGRRFRELLGYLAAHSREPGLQKKATVWLERLGAESVGSPPS